MLYKIAFEGLSYIILITTLIGMLTSNIIFNNMVIFIFILLISSYLWSKILARSDRSKNILAKISPLIGLLSALLFAYFTTKTTLLLVVFTIIYLIVWIRGLKLKDEIKYNSDIFKRFIITLIIGLVFSLDMFLGNTRWYMKDLLPYILIFVAITFIFSIRLNLYNAYLASNAINKSKNIKIFNILSNVFIFIVVGVIVYASFEITDNTFINQTFNSLTDFLIIPLVFLTSIIFKLLEKIFSRLDFDRINSEEIMQLQNSLEELVEEGNTQNESARIIFDFLGWFVLAAVIILLVYILYRISKNMEEDKEVGDNLIKEEKEFILDRKTILDSIKNKFKSKKTYMEEDIHIVRKIFIDISKAMVKKGHEYKMFLTPREFMMKNKEEQAQIEDFINQYEKVRYGGKSISKEDVQKVREYKKRFQEEE